ncbi:hypothetical protein CONPUDRAFT_167902 [Coniophora puteana RWD-64-598 SS2]|uniref:Uncharacterized protein n=1 Tax=Coniophora puteana (strain RWD-64-598) TaxID=741705 RepID=A0A5M3MH21_CONPW|nr:uncharacterized protein CONPUDRAFT_167902 [Coniophora puteana RWD-64-598 SS2]EIW77911.1 hypothetical protein CONPUDRAFT_167902 [Coniophora puteana RWD-64-598 SS2]
MAVLHSLLRVTSASMAVFSSLLAIPVRCVTRVAFLYASFVKALASTVALFLLSFGTGVAIFLALVSGVCLSARSTWEAFLVHRSTLILRKFRSIWTLSEAEAEKHSQANLAVTPRLLYTPELPSTSREVSYVGESHATPRPRSRLSTSSASPISPEPWPTGRSNPPEGSFTIEDIVNSPYRRHHTRSLSRSSSSGSSTSTGSPSLPASAASPAVWPVGYESPPEGSFTTEDIISSPYRRLRRSKDDA